MNMAFSISTLALMAFSAILLTLCGCLGFRKNNKRNFSFLSYFPFEINEGNDACSRVSSFAVFLFAFSLALASTGMLWNADFRPYLSVGIFMAIFGVLKAVSLVFLFRVPAYHFKFHCGVSVVYFCLVALTSAFAGIFFMNMSKAFEGGALALMILEFFFAIVLVGLVINPKLSKWTELESVGNEDGSVEVRRPKPFVLAFSEWCALCIDLLSVLTFVIGILIISMN